MKPLNMAIYKHMSPRVQLLCVARVLNGFQGDTSLTKRVIQETFGLYFNSSTEIGLFLIDLGDYIKELEL
jgi:hypothetical protein